MWAGGLCSCHEGMSSSDEGTSRFAISSVASVASHSYLRDARKMCSHWALILLPEHPTVAPDLGRSGGSQAVWLGCHCPAIGAFPFERTSVPGNTHGTEKPRTSSRIGTLPDSLTAHPAARTAGVRSGRYRFVHSKSCPSTYLPRLTPPITRHARAENSLGPSHEKSAPNT